MPDEFRQTKARRGAPWYGRSGHANAAFAAAAPFIRVEFVGIEVSISSAARPHAGRLESVYRNVLCDVKHFFQVSFRAWLPRWRGPRRVEEERAFGRSWMGWSVRPAGYLFQNSFVAMRRAASELRSPLATLKPMVSS